MRGELTVDVWCVGVGPTEGLVHDLNLCFEQLVLLMCLARIFGIALQSLHLAVQVAFLVLGAPDVINGCARSDGSDGSRERGRIDGGDRSSPLVKISHLLALDPPWDGTALFSSSKRSFISLRRLRSANL